MELDLIQQWKRGRRRSDEHFMQTDTFEERERHAQ